MDGRTVHERARLSLRPRARFPGPARGPEGRDPPHRPAGQGGGGARDPGRDGRPDRRRSAPALPEAVHRPLRGGTDPRPAGRGAGDRDRSGARHGEATHASPAVDGDRDHLGRHREAGPDVLQPTVGGGHLQGGSGARRLGHRDPVPGPPPAGQPGGGGPRRRRAGARAHGTDHPGPPSLRRDRHPDDPGAGVLRARAAPVDPGPDPPGRDRDRRARGSRHGAAAGALPGGRGAARARDRTAQVRRAVHAGARGRAPQASARVGGDRDRASGGGRADRPARSRPCPSSPRRPRPVRSRKSGRRWPPLAR